MYCIFFFKFCILTLISTKWCFFVFLMKDAMFWKKYISFWILCKNSTVIIWKIVLKTHKSRQNVLRGNAPYCAALRRFSTNFSVNNTSISRNINNQVGTFTQLGLCFFINKDHGCDYFEKIENEFDGPNSFKM